MTAEEPPSQKGPFAAPSSQGLGSVVAQQNGRHISGRPPTARGTVGKIIGSVVSLSVLAVFLFLGAIYLQLNSNIEQSPLTTDSANVGTTFPDGPANILIIGSDTREGQARNYGGEDAGFGQADVMMIAHISGDRKNATIISIPRDTMMPIPECIDPKTGEVYPEEEIGRANSSLLHGGPSCTVAMLENFTGLKINNFMIGDFTGVEAMSDAVGGVEVCVTDDVYDPLSGLDLKKGNNIVKGDTALAFLRTRHGFENGSDLGRIRSQQAFMASLARKITSEQTLSNPVSVYSLADAATKNLTVDSNLASIPALVGLAREVRTIDPAKITFVMLPVEEYPEDPNRVQPNKRESRDLFEKVQKDEDLSAPPAETPDTGNTSTPSQTAVAKENIVVNIYDGTGQGIGRDYEILQALTEGGFTKAVSGGVGSYAEETAIYYPADEKSSAEEVAKALEIPDSYLVESDEVQNVTLVVGADFATGKAFVAPTASPSTDPMESQPHTGDEDICAVVSDEAKNQ